MGMNVNLTPQLEELVRSKVITGHYASASEVIAESLHLLEQRDRLKEIKLDELRGDIRAGMSSGLGMAWVTDALEKKARSRPTKSAAAQLV